MCEESRHFVHACDHTVYVGQGALLPSTVRCRHSQSVAIRMYGWGYDVNYSDIAFTVREHNRHLRLLQV